MFFRQINEPNLAQYAYLVGCQKTGEAVVIDPQRDLDVYVDLAKAENLRIVAVTETHIHADFLSGVREAAHQLGVKVYLSAQGGEDWSYRWPAEGDYDVVWLEHGDRFEIGNISFQAVHTPGHTPEHICFLITDKGGGADEPIGIASGDFVFVGDLGRPDLLESAAGVVGAREPSARALYDSLQDFLSYPDFMQVWPGHGAGSACGKALGAVPDSTVGYERRFNASILAASGGQDAFVTSILEGQPEPPLYFARMKRLNRDGPQLLGGLPQPRELDAAALVAVAHDAGSVVLDTRTDRGAFMAGHLVGSLWTPMGKSLSTLAGSFIDDDVDIHLIADEAEVEEAVRQLLRIGLDRVTAWASPATLEAALAAAPEDRRSTEVIDFAALRARDGDAAVLDVRGAAEFATGHLPGASQIAHTRLAAHLEEVPAAQQVAVHCASGFRAAAACSLLERAGRHVAYVDDAFANWRKAGGDVVTGEREAVVS